MQVINFSNAQLYLKGHILNVGINIISDPNITESDRTDLIGIGEADSKHYKEVIEFFNIAGLFVKEDINYKACVERYEKLKGLEALLKKEGFLATQDNQDKQARLENVLRIKSQIETSTKAIKHYLSQIKQEDISNELLAIIEKEYSEIKDYPHTFKATQYAKEIYNEIVATKKQHLGAMLTQIKNELGL